MIPKKSLKQIFLLSILIMLLPKKSPSIIRSIKTLIKQPSRVAKEYVQASSFDQHKIPATS